VKANQIIAHTAAMLASALGKLVAGTHDFSEQYILLATKFVPQKSASKSMNLYEDFLKTLCRRVKKTCSVSLFKLSVFHRDEAQTFRRRWRESPTIGFHNPDKSEPKTRKGAKPPR
jgi:hypothetical protein